MTINYNATKILAHTAFYPAVGFRLNDNHNTSEFAALMRQICGKWIALIGKRIEAYHGDIVIDLAAIAKFDYAKFMQSIGGDDVHEEKTFRIYWAARSTGSELKLGNISDSGYDYMEKCHKTDINPSWFPAMIEIKFTPDKEHTHEWRMPKIQFHLVQLFTEELLTDLVYDPLYC